MELNSEMCLFNLPTVLLELIVDIIRRSHIQVIQWISKRHIIKHIVFNSLSICMAMATSSAFAVKTVICMTHEPTMCETYLYMCKSSIQMQKKCKFFDSFFIHSNTMLVERIDFTNSNWKIGRTCCNGKGIEIAKKNTVKNDYMINGY